MSHCLHSGDGFFANDAPRMIQIQTPAKLTALKTVVVNGSLHKPSRTQVLLQSIQACVAAHIPLETQFVELADVAPLIGAGFDVAQFPEPARNAIRQIETADFLIIGCPVFRGSMPGLFKHLFDLIGMESLTGKPVLLAATGGSQRHSLVIDHQLRPLFNFFQALTLPIGVYATQPDIEAGKIVDAALQARVELAAQLALPSLHAHLHRLNQVA